MLADFQAAVGQGARLDRVVRDGPGSPYPRLQAAVREPPVSRSIAKLTAPPITDGGRAGCGVRGRVGWPVGDIGAAVECQVHGITDLIAGLSAAF